MVSAGTLLFFIVLLLIALLLEPLAKKFFIPFSIILIAVGFIGSEITVNVFNIDTGIRWDNFKAIVFYILLPILIFRSAVEIDFSALMKDFIPIVVIVLPLMFLAIITTAAAIYYGLDRGAAFPWFAALISGALLAATDPTPITTILRRLNCAKRMRLLLESESLFNDATAIVLFTIFVAVATNQQQTTIAATLLRFLEVFVGSLIIGAGAAYVVHWLINCITEQRSLALFSILSAYAAFIVAENRFGYSGVITVLVYGMVLSFLTGSSAKQDNFSHQFLQSLAYIAEAMIFLLAGITITLAMFMHEWLAILIGIAAVVFVRVAMIFGFMPLVSLLPGVTPIDLKQQTILVWGGVRGTVTLALALSLPLSLTYWYTIQAIAYGVVLFTLLLQTATLPLLLKRLALR